LGFRITNKSFDFAHFVNKTAILKELNLPIHASDTNRKKIYKLMSILFSNGKSFRYKKKIVILYTTINISNYSAVNG
jgi:hypothetical protein